jgi:serine/threonine protein kinase/tetratricopeptide (TPR) repeat protein
VAAVIAIPISEYNFLFVSLAPHSRLGPYEIIGSLGTGGMGEVYRARDTRLGREVALKVLPPEVTSEPERLARFDREARVVAALNHPHIVTIYSTEIIDGIRFLTMELVEGPTLTEVIAPGGLDVPRFLEIAVALADALTAAHAKQITHRDLKPGNVMIANDGRVKVLDFGLARVGGNELAEESTAATLAPVTQIGMVVGTMPYMSPEQVEGRALDARTDLFSLGVIFYELLTGDRPFQGASSPALISAILRDVPSSVSTIRPGVPETLARLIARCLEKQPEDRVQTARDVYNELRHLQKQYESGASRQSSSSGIRAGASDSVSVCVMPFSVRGGDEESAALAEGLTDDITTGLSKFGNLRVVSHAAAERVTSQHATRHHGARHVVEGTVRRAGRRIRISVRVLDTKTGAHLWADNFDRDADSGAFAIQDDVANRVAATLGDPTGVLARAIVGALADVPLDRWTVAELIVRYHAYIEQFRREEHGRLRDALEQALEREPRAAEGWAVLSILYEQEHSNQFNRRPDSLARQWRAANRAVELDANSQQAWVALASAHLFNRDLPALRGAVERAVSINPLNADLVAHAAFLLSVAGDADRSLELFARVISLKPHHSGWYHFTPFNAYYARGEDEAALREAKLINMPLLPHSNLSAAAAAGQLGRSPEARAALEAVQRHSPSLLDPQVARDAWAMWIWDQEFLDRLVDGLEKALALRQPSSATTTGQPASDAGSGSAFVVTVLPFQAPGGSDAAAFADGLTQGIVVGLSRFHYLRVVTRAVTRDAVTTGYVLQGTVRESGGTVRVVVQLIDTQSGANVWADTFDRQTGTGVSRATLDTEAGTEVSRVPGTPVPVSPFALQDDLIAMIVATTADLNGALVRSIASAVRSKPVEALTPYETVLRRYAYLTVQSPAEHALVRDALERAVQQAPGYAEAWAVLAQIYVDEHSQEFNVRPDPLERARAAAHKAVEIDPASVGAHLALAMIAYFRRDFSAFRAAAERTLALNPLDTSAMAMLGSLTAYAGDWEKGIALCARARALNTQHPGVYWISTIVDRYRRHDYTGALEILNRFNMPGYPQGYVMRAAIYGQLGRIDEGRALLREAEAKLPGISTANSGTRRAWLGDELDAHVQEGLGRLG